jgi:hypothetical protein
LYLLVSSPPHRALAARIFARQQSREEPDR